MKRVEVIPKQSVVWQTDTAKIYLCARCLCPVHTSYEGNVTPRIECRPDEHVVTWPEE